MTNHSENTHNATCDNNVLSDGTFHINHIPFGYYVLIKNQEQWDNVKNYLHEKRDEIPFKPTYLKQMAFCSMGINFSYSDNTRFGYGSDSYQAKQEALKEILFNQLRF